MTPEEFIEHARGEGWRVSDPPPAKVDERVTDRAPDDLSRFLELCGGVRCGGGVSVGQRIVPAQEEILGERYEDDPSADWFVIAEEGEEETAERIVIDLGQDHRGRCYEAFWDRFGVAGSMPVVASSFSDLLDRLIAAGGAPYWSDADLSLGDAYD